MPAVRPLSALRPTLFAMADEAQRANILAVKAATERVKDDVARRGRRYTLRGRGGKQVPLAARADVKVFGSLSTPVGMVRGVPEGFWHIVQYGSGAHLITSTKGRGGVGRVTRSGRVASRFYTSSQTLRRFGAGESLGALQPLRTPYGPRQFVHHPGHRVIARPWDAAMEMAPDLVGETLAYEQTKAMTAAFFGR